MNAEVDNEEEPPSKVARGIPKVRKSIDEQNDKESEDDQQTPRSNRSKNTPSTGKGKKGSIANNPIKLTAQSVESDDDSNITDDRFVLHFN